MRIGGSLLLIALGAILRFAVTQREYHSVNVHVVGVILMIVGVIGLVAELIWSTHRRRTVVEHRAEPFVDPYAR